MTLLPSGHVLVTGGLGPAGVVLNDAEIHDPATESWSSAGIMGQGVFRVGASRVGLRPDTPSSLRGSCPYPASS